MVLQVACGSSTTTCAQLCGVLSLLHRGRVGARPLGPPPLLQRAVHAWQGPSWDEWMAHTGTGCTALLLGSEPRIRSLRLLYDVVLVPGVIPVNWQTVVPRAMGRRGG